MQSAYHSPGKGLEQHNVLMVDTQINLRASAHSTSKQQLDLFSCTENHGCLHRKPLALVQVHCVFDLHFIMYCTLLRY